MTCLGVLHGMEGGGREGGGGGGGGMFSCWRACTRFSIRRFEKRRPLLSVGNISKGFSCAIGLKGVSGSYLPWE